MKTIQLTKKDFKDTKSYYKEYIGSEDVADLEGNLEIEGDLGWVMFPSIKVSGYINCKAGSGIKAGEGIEAGSGIEAGWGIEAGSGIKAGLAITCKLSLSFYYRLFAGTAYWRNVGDAEKTITCGKLEPKDGATVEYGIVKELGLPEEEKSESEVEEIIELNGKKYKRIN